MQWLSPRHSLSRRKWDWQQFSHLPLGRKSVQHVPKMSNCSFKGTLRTQCDLCLKHVVPQNNATRYSSTKKNKADEQTQSNKHLQATGSINACTLQWKWAACLPAVSPVSPMLPTDGLSVDDLDPSSPAAARAAGGELMPPSWGPSWGGGGGWGSESASCCRGGSCWGNGLWQLTGCPLEDVAHRLDSCGWETKENLVSKYSGAITFWSFM